MKVLATGTAGFIGSNFLHWILDSQKDVQITSFDALTYAGNLDNISTLLKHPKHKFVHGDLCNAELVDQTLKTGGFDMVINFAAESHVDRSISGPKAFIDTNITGTFNLLESTRKHLPKARYVQVSTDEVYGSLGDTGYFTESTPINPSSPYSSSKASADLLVNAYHHTFKLNTITTRCSNNYGPRQFPEKLIPLMFLNSQQNKKLPVYGTGKNVRDWIHVLDHGKGVWAAATKGKSGEVYNFGSNNEHSNINIVKKILEFSGKPETLIEYVADRAGHDWRYAIDAAKAHKELNWKPEISFADGLNETLKWYQSNNTWVENIRSGRYRELRV